MSTIPNGRTSWTHVICDTCWQTWRSHETPLRISDPKTEPCCACGNDTASGIILRADPRKMPCQGLHRQAAF